MKVKFSFQKAILSKKGPHKVMSVSGRTIINTSEEEAPQGSGLCVGVSLCFEERFFSFQLAASIFSTFMLCRKTKVKMHLKAVN